MPFPDVRWPRARARSREYDAQTLERALQASPPLIEHSRPLRASDFRLIGTFIQTYCFCDFNARRIVDTVRTAKTGTEARFAAVLNDTDALDHLRRCADEEALPASLRDGIRKAAVTLDMHRPIRHRFAHCAVRRTPDGRGYFMLTMNANEAKRRGTAIGMPDHAMRGVMPRSHLRDELRGLQVHGRYLARLAAHLHEHRDELRTVFEANLHGDTGPADAAGPDRA